MNNTNTAPDTTNANGAISMTELGAVGPEAGEHRFFLNHLATVKITADDSPSGMGAVEFVAPRGFATPVHQHDEQDELLYLVDGQIRLGLGEETMDVGSGSFVSLPKGVPHVFTVISEEARFMSVTAGAGVHPTFERFVVAVSEETDPTDLPAPVEIDPGAVAMAGAAHGMQILGPPPVLQD